MTHAVITGTAVDPHRDVLDRRHGFQVQGVRRRVPPWRPMSRHRLMLLHLRSRHPRCLTPPRLRRRLLRRPFPRRLRRRQAVL